MLQLTDSLQSAVVFDVGPPEIHVERNEECEIDYFLAFAQRSKPTDILQLLAASEVDLELAQPLKIAEMT